MRLFGQDVQMRPSMSSRAFGVAAVSRWTRALTRSHHSKQASASSANERYSGSRFAEVGTKSLLAILTVFSAPPLDSGSNGSHVSTLQP